MLRLALESDASQITTIHMNVLPDDLLPRLGRTFLEKSFYPALLGSSHGFVVADVEEDRLNGFCVFSYDTDALSRDAMVRGGAVFRTLLGRIVQQPSIFFELMSVWRTKFSFPAGRELAVGKLPEIYLLGVRDGHQGRGSGSKMIGYGIKRLKPRFDLCLARTSKEDARSFYMKNGFTEVGLETRGKKSLFVLVREWDKSDVAG